MNYQSILGIKITSNFCKLLRNMMADNREFLLFLLMTILLKCVMRIGPWPHNWSSKKASYAQNNNHFSWKCFYPHLSRLVLKRPRPPRRCVHQSPQPHDKLVLFKKRRPRVFALVKLHESKIERNEKKFNVT